MAIPVALKKYKSEIQNINPDTHIVPYKAATWDKRFGKDPDFQYLTKHYPDGISRGQIAHLVQNIGDFDFSQLRKSFFAAMIWGYGTTGYGPYRTKLMFGSSNIETTLEDTYFRLKSGNIVQAYERIQFQIAQCGPAFFTKFFYFVGLGMNLKPLPLIWDSRVKKSIFHSTILGNGIQKPARIEGYHQYIILVNEWADELGCRPDAIEYFLFDWTGN
jgi:hypothetical protein